MNTSISEPEAPHEPNRWPRWLPQPERRSDWILAFLFVGVACTAIAIRNEFLAIICAIVAGSVIGGYLSYRIDSPRLRKMADAIAIPFELAGALLGFPMNYVDSKLDTPRGQAVLKTIAGVLIAVFGALFFLIAVICVIAFSLWGF